MHTPARPRSIFSRPNGQQAPEHMLMLIPVQITFRGVDPSPTLEAKIREQAEKLESFFDPITSCRVVVEARHHHRKGNLYHVRVDVTVPDAEIVASRDPKEHHAHEDAYVAARDAFHAVQRRLEDYARQRRGQIKHHHVPTHGRIREIIPAANYGVIESSDGREIRFERGSVIEGKFDGLEAGDEVRFVEVEGAEIPTASTVHPIGKHHVAGSPVHGDRDEHA